MTTRRGAVLLPLLLLPLLGSARSYADEWSWIDALEIADSRTKEKLKICVISLNAHLASITSAMFDYEGEWEQFIPPIQDAKVDIEHHACRGTVRYLRGKFRNDITFDPGGADEWKNWALRTDKLLASTEKHPLYDRFLTVQLPPVSLREWNQKLFLLPGIDPWSLFGGFLGGGPDALRQYVETLGRIESEETGSLIRFSFYPKDSKGRGDAYFDSGVEFLMVKTQGGFMSGRDFHVDMGEEWDWQKFGGVQFPTRYLLVRYYGPNRAPVREYDLRFKNIRINDQSSVREADLTLDALPIPNRVVGIDRRSSPIRDLVRMNGKVRELRPSDNLEMSPALKERLSDERKRAPSQDESEAQAVLTRRWRWSVATYLCAAAAVLTAVFLGRRFYVRMQVRHV